jgi:2-octaprenyl-6-methoxyphenol hydroxylase
MDTEIIIAGGGLVGNALAIALAQGGVRVTVIDPLPREQQIAAGFDGRTSAISSGTVRILTHMNVWQHIAPEAQPIHDIRVCDQDKPGFVHYSDKDVGEPFGYIVENNILRKGLYIGLEGEHNIRVMQGKVVGFSTTAQSATTTLEDGSTLTAPLLIAADGRFSNLREQSGISSRVISYDQTAIVCVIEHEKPHDGLALEKFYPAGPFALLPLKPTPEGINRSGVVWTEHDDDAPKFVALSDADFNAELQRRVGEGADNYWGTVKVVGKRFAYPLKLMHAESFIATRFALVGDAAHGIHPIAGQGVNLGYRDVAVLAELLLDQRKLGLDLGTDTVLAHYQRWRRFDSFSMTASTDILNRLFSNRVPGLSLIRRAGMVAVEHMPPVKKYFMRHAMGLIGDLPKMMRDDKAA